jgi:plastocyanin
VATLCLGGTLALAEQKPTSAPKNEDLQPPVQLVAELVDGRIRCDPAELRLPAQTNVQLQIVNRTKHQVTLTAPKMFENKNVLHHDGDLVHVASDDGYLIKQGGEGLLRVRTLAEGQYPYACTSTNDRNAPFKGTLTLAAPAN